MAESTKGVEENDKGTEGKRGNRRERGNAEWRQEEEEEKEEKEEKDDDAKEEGEERATKGKSQATCTRQQPPTSEELIINLLSPSPNAVLTRPPSLHFHLRLSLTYPLSRPLCSLHSHLSFLPRLFPFPFNQSFPPFSLFSSLPFSLLRPRCVGLCVYDYDYSRSRFRRFPFTLSLSISPPSYRPPNLVATFGLSNAHDTMHTASRCLKSRISFWPTI